MKNKIRYMLWFLHLRKPARMWLEQALQDAQSRKLITVIVPSNRRLIMTYALLAAAGYVVKRWLQKKKTNEI